MSSSLGKLRELATQAERYEEELMRKGAKSLNTRPPYVAVGELAKKLDAVMEQHGDELGRGAHGLLLQKTLAHLGHMSDYFRATA
jgi:hypothetical protein